jgi:hypothetical protein
MIIEVRWYQPLARVTIRAVNYLSFTGNVLETLLAYADCLR